MHSHVHISSDKAYFDQCALYLDLEYQIRKIQGNIKLSIMTHPINVNSFYILMNGLLGEKGEIRFYSFSTRRIFSNFRIGFVKN